MKSKSTENLTIKYNELTASQFIELWETVWGAGPSPEQTELAMKNTLFRISVFDGGKIVGMARMLGDLGLDYFIKDVVVRPEYQKMGIGRQNHLKHDMSIEGQGRLMERVTEIEIPEGWYQRKDIRKKWVKQLMSMA